MGLVSLFLDMRGVAHLAMSLVFAYQGGYFPFKQLFLALHCTGCVQARTFFDG